MIDPRTSIISKRMKKVKRIVAVAGGKGGVGKSSVASMLSLALSKKGYRVGLFDLDFHGPSTHVILGAKKDMPVEDMGIIPPLVSGIKFMSITHYIGNNPSPIRGEDLTNSMIELLAITRWEDLDYLILDVPPGLGDTTLDIIRLLPKTKFLIVHNNSKLVTETVKKLVKMLKEHKVPIIGGIENMRVLREESCSDSKFLGSIRYDRSFEKALGCEEKLLRTYFFKDITNIIPKIEKRAKK
ncbi:MAG: P-loop NTPase [Candidatus Aenigmarchaeota archaeon]|nr:P-loop NTPase [Candidatus Aenigmarchaeota archaeon]